MVAEKGRRKKLVLIAPARSELQGTIDSSCALQKGQSASCSQTQQIVERPDSLFNLLLIEILLFACIHLIQFYLMQS